MAEWEELNAATLFPTEIAGIVESCEVVGDQVGTVMETAADVLDIVSQFVQGYDDVLTTVVEELQDLIAATVQQFTQTGVYVLKHAPMSSKVNTEPFVWLSDVSKSLDDSYDENRPILVDEHAYIGVVLIMASTPGFEDIVKLFNKMLLLFGLLVPTVDQVEAWPTIGDQFEVKPGVGRAPDWETKRMADYIPQLGQAADVLMDYSDGVATAAAAVDLYGMFADQLRLKAAALRAIGDIVGELMKEIASLLAFSGAYILPIYGQGDKDWLQDQIMQSSGGPLDLPDLKYSAGVVFLATGGTTAPAELLFTLMGIEIPEIDTSEL